MMIYCNVKKASVECLFILLGLMHLWKACESLEVKSTLGPFQHLTIADPDLLERIKSHESLSLIFYNKAEESSLKAEFLSEFDFSTTYLADYGINSAVLDCVVHPSVPECQHEKADNYSFYYKAGQELFSLEMDTLFDADAIISNSLQLLLLADVPIVTSQSDREKLQSKLIGKQDLLFFHAKTIGTPEHRVFMEIAHAYRDQYKFAVSTNADVMNSLPGSEDMTDDTEYSMWTIYCSKASSQEEDNNDCKASVYRGVFLLSGLTNFVERIQEQTLFFAPEDGNSSLFEPNTLPIIFIYTNSKNKLIDEASTLARDMKGYADLVVVNMDDEECRTLATTKNGFVGPAPGVSVRTLENSFIDMPAISEFNVVDVRGFLLTHLILPASPGLTPEEEAFTRAMETQDDEVAEAVFKNKRREDSVHLPSVLKNSFQDIVVDADVKVVLYYLPFDPSSIASLEYFEEAAKILAARLTGRSQDVLATVNCFDATDLCGKENVTTYPVVRIHRKNNPYHLYQGGMDADSIVRVADLLKLKFPVKLRNEDELNRFVAGDFPSKFTSLSPTSVLFVAKKNDEETWTQFRSAAFNNLDAFVAMAEVADDLVDVVAKKFQVSAPCVVSVHHDDAITPVRKLESVVSVDQVIAFVRQSMIKSVPELTVANYPTLKARNLPFVIAFTNQSCPVSGEVKSAVTSIASNAAFSNSIFCWMDVKPQSTGYWLLEDYTPSVVLPTLAVVDHQKGQVFAHQMLQAESSDKISDWLSNVFSGQETPTKTFPGKKWTAPGPHYDFLAMMDNQRQQGSTRFESKEQAERIGEEYSGSIRLEPEEEKTVRTVLLERARNAKRENSEKRAEQSTETEDEHRDEKDSTHDPSEF